MCLVGYKYNIKLVVGSIQVCIDPANFVLHSLFNLCHYAYLIFTVLFLLEVLLCTCVYESVGLFITHSLSTIVHLL